MSRVVVHLRSGHSIPLEATTSERAECHLVELEDIRFRKVGPPLRFLKRRTSVGWASFHTDDIIALELEDTE